MPLPLILIGAAAVAGATGIAGAATGAVKMKEANDKMQTTDERHKENLQQFELYQNQALKQMDRLGKKELAILQSFEEFSRVFEKIHNKPNFKAINIHGVQLPEYNAEELKEVSIGAGVLLGGIGGAALGTAGGFAAAGATTAAVMALGTASTGTAIASLSGVAATNATLAALGGGALAAGGGGMALGSAVLGGATLGIGLLVGGAIFGITGFVLSGKAEEAKVQMEAAEKEIVKVCNYLAQLYNIAEVFYITLNQVNTLYTHHLQQLKVIVQEQEKTDWNQLTEEEKLVVQNSVLLVGLLFNMCKVQIVQSTDDQEPQINEYEVSNTVAEAKSIIGKFTENIEKDDLKQNSQNFVFKKRNLKYNKIIKK